MGNKEKKTIDDYADLTLPWTEKGWREITRTI